MPETWPVVLGATTVVPSLQARLMLASVPAAPCDGVRPVTVVLQLLGALLAVP